MKLKFELVNGYGLLVDKELFPELKILFAEKELNLEGIPVFEWRDFEPNEKSLLSMFYNVCKATYPEFDEWIEAKEYKKWLEKSNPAKYTDEDLRKAFHAGEERILKREYEKGLSELDSYTNLKKSLQKYPSYIEVDGIIGNKANIVNVIW